MSKQKSFSAKQALEIALNAVEKGDKDKASKYFEAVLAKYPDNKDALEGYKKLNPNSLFRSDLDELKVLFNKAKFREVEIKSKMFIEKYPEVQELRTYLGTTLGMRGEHAEALTHFIKAAELTPLNAGVQFNLGNSYKANNALKNAEASYLKAITLAPNHMPSYNNIGNIYLVYKDYDTAISYFKKAIELAPDTVDILINLAECYKFKGEYQVAIMHYNKIISLDATITSVFLDLALCEKLIGNIDEAIKIFEVVITQDPDNIDAHNNFGNLLMEAAEYEAAISHFEKAIEINSEFSVPYNNLSKLYKELGQFDKAVSLLEDAHETMPKSIDILYYLADAFIASGDYKEALETYKKSFELFPTGPICIINLAILNFILGDDKASAHYLALLDDKHIEKVLDFNKRQSCTDYKNYLGALLNFNEKITRSHKGEKLWIIGDSEALASKGHKIKFGKLDLVADTKWVVGGKASELAKDGESQCKSSVMHLLNEIEEESNVLFMFGSVDCQQNENDVDIAKETVAGYFKNTYDMAIAGKAIAAYCAVSAPFIKADIEGADELVANIKKFNAELKALCDKNGLVFVDTYALTDAGKGYADGSKHLDALHLNPTAINDALAL